tara:strand:+ start:122339 stop:123319 length:981 start_codon:yes stop_codon:yes gene_type:complete
MLNFLAKNKSISWDAAQAFFNHESNSEAVKYSKAKKSFVKDTNGKIYALTKKELGTGGEAKVKQAIMKDGDTPCAVKILRLDPDYYDAAGEADILQKLGRLLGSAERSLPTIRKFESMGNVNKKRYVFQELIPGITMTKFLKKEHLGQNNKHKVSELDRLIAAYMIAKEIQYLHRNNIVHGDLKLDNFIYDPNSTKPHKVTAIDFNFGKILEPGRTEKKSRYALVTPGFAAPELSQRDAHKMHTYSYASDIFTFGCVLKKELMLPNVIFYSMLETDSSKRPSIDTVVESLQEKIQAHSAINQRSSLMDTFNKIEEADLKPKPKLKF